MDIIPLAARSIDELAVIIYHHAKKHFGGYELLREICPEVAARSRCNKRRMVRSSENVLLAKFYNKLPAMRRKGKTIEQAAAALMNIEAIVACYDSHSIDLNGLDELGHKILVYLKMRGMSPEDRFSGALRISNRADFGEPVEFLTRLGLVSTGHQGRQLTQAGR